MRHSRSQPPFSRHIPSTCPTKVIEFYENANGVFSNHLGEAHSKDLVDRYRARTLETLKGLKGSTARKLKRVFESALKEGILILMYSGYRGFPEQWELRKKYLQGGPLAARPGESWHNFQRAVDTVPIDTTGSAVWNSPKYGRIAEIAESEGLKSGASFGDKPHIYDDSGVSLWYLKQKAEGLEHYENLEAQMTGKHPVKRDVDFIAKDNLQIAKKVVIWSVSAGVIGFLGYKAYKYVQRSN